MTGGGGTGSQPSIPPSATQAAAPPAACRNLLLVNLELKLAPLSRHRTGYFFAIILELRKVHCFPLRHNSIAWPSEALAAAWGPQIAILRRGSRACLVRRC